MNTLYVYDEAPAKTTKISYKDKLNISTKNYFVGIAMDFKYDEDVISAIKKAKTVAEAERILVTARHKRGY